LADKAVVEPYGLPLVAYEGGEWVVAKDNLNITIKDQAQADPRMYDLYRKMIQYWDQYVGNDNLFMQYTLNGLNGNYGYWALLQSTSEVGSQRYDALASMILPAGDITLDGKVDYADFQVLAANFDMNSAWRAQGDLNHDGAVNAADLTILRANLD